MESEQHRHDASESMSQAKTSVATLAGGCFWCLEAAFEQLYGVVSVLPGYMGGQDTRPTYEAVCRGDTGHAEVVQITFDPAIISYETLLLAFFAVHDPTTLNRQGHDVGTQYRSAIFYHDASQKEAAEALIAHLAGEGGWEIGRAHV
jgi:peptide-methionine (S)-S-oxide reductase